MPKLPPVPNTPLRDDPTQDSIWKRWLNLLKQSYSGLGTVTSVGLSLPTSVFDVTGSPVTSSGTLTATFDNQAANTVFAGPASGSPDTPTFRTLSGADVTLTVGTTPIASGTAGRLLYEGPGNVLQESSGMSFDGTTLAVTGLSNSGNTVLGDAAADSLTINAGTLTIGSNYTATRAAGTLAAGTTNVLTNNVTAAGDSGGTTNVRGQLFNLTISGTANFAAQTSFRQETFHSGSGTVTNAQVAVGILSATSSGSFTNGNVYNTAFVLSSTGGITTGTQYNASSPQISGAGGITTLYGFRADTLGNSKVGTAVGFFATEFTGSTTAMRGFQSSLSSGPGKANAYFDGTADNLFAGNMRIGSTTAPTVALDVTGAALISSTLGVTGTLSANTIQVLTGTTATVYNTSATTVNAFGGASVALNVGNSGGANTISGATTFNQAVTFGSTARLKAFTVGTLPAAGTAGRMAYVTDALAPTYLATIVGGGAIVTPVFDNGTNWVAM